MPDAPSPLSAWLSPRVQSLNAERSRLRSVELGWSWGRLLSFALIVVVAVFLDAHPVWIALGMTLAAVLFIAAVRQHLAWRTRRELIDAQLVMLEESSRRCGGAVVLIRASGRPEPLIDHDSRLDPVVNDGVTWPLTDQELDDLDLYAPPVGIFGLLNRASSDYGARRLAHMLENPCLAIPPIIERESAVRWLADHPEIRTRIMAAASFLRGQDPWLQRLAAAVRGASTLNYGTLSPILRLWSLVSLFLTFYSLSKLRVSVSPYAYFLLGLLIFNGAIFQFLRRKLKAALDPWRETASAAAGLLATARQAAADLPVENGAPPTLVMLRESFAAAIPSVALPALCRRLPWTDTGGPMHLFFNAMYFYDLHLAETILAHTVPRRVALLRTFAALAEFEALASLASFSWEQPGACWPQLVDGSERGAAPSEAGHPRRELAIRAGRHPLIDPARVIPNDLRLTAEQRLWVITGSNMAGKSTFLRMAALNTLLAQIGAACIADEVTLSPLRLITDLRARDNLAREESYFLAEVRHLRRLLDSPDGEAPLLGLIDEPFRGTNSEERLAASLAVCEHLIQSSGLYLVATHEQRLTELAQPPAPATNFHFQEKLGEDGTVFDYHIRPGPATTRNALRVLAREGFPQTLLDRADVWLKENQS